MSPDSYESIRNTDRAASPIVDMMLTPYDELVEVDLVHDKTHTLKHMDGKYFVPRAEGGFREMFRCATEYLIHPDDQKEYLRECDPDYIYQELHNPANHGEVRSRFRFRLTSGNWRWVDQVAVGGPGYGLPDGTYYSFLVDVQDEVEPDGGEAAAAISVGRNALTGLLWEEQFFECAKKYLAERSGKWCVIAIDLEHFKLFNEWYDRSQGDQLLAQIGAKLKRVEKSTGGIACYFGQDDFALLVPDDREEIQKLYDELHELIKKYGTSVGFMPAFGICPADGGDTVEELYDRAAMASRRAKDDYHNRIREFTPAMYEKTDRDYRILSDFQKGLEDHEIYFQLQPQCQINTEKVVGAESLVRWQKANGEQVPPGTFVPVLEQYGFITDLDKYVWEEVCAWQKKWIDKGRTTIPISVNVSQMDIFTLDVPAYFEMLMEKYQLPTDVVKIEITESAYVDNNAVAETVRRLREKGFLVLMDDFGSGYSSLNMLRNLNVDIIKLDAQFLRMSGDDRKGIHIMESIVNMAKTMGVPIIVEGVETKEESNFLAGLGCRYVQGYFFYRPMGVEDFEELIADPKHIDTRGFRFKAREQFHTREFLDQNVFSDTVLNNILGPVAFYSWHGDEVDVIRFNQQFCDEVKIPHSQKHMRAIQRLMPQEDIPGFFGLFEHAMKDPLGGATGEIRINRPDGTVSQFRVHFFFLEEDESGKKFYGSIHDLTDFITLNDHMRLLSQVSPDTVAFMRKRQGNWSYHVVIHGLADLMGMSKEQLQGELSDGTFYERVEESDREQLKEFAQNADRKMDNFSKPFLFNGPDGRKARLRAWFYGVHDAHSGVEYILVLRK